LKNGSSKYFFKSGWHVTPKREDAQKYLEKFSSKKSRSYVVAKVQIRGEIRKKPRSPYPIFLAEEMKILEELIN
jgi:hypothetical protein